MAPIRSNYLAFGQPNFSQDEINAVTRVLESGWVGMGPETAAFEQELSEYLQAPYVVTTNSCTSALFLSLLVSGIGPGDEVICPSLTWCSTANAVLYLGAKPVFCDVDASTLCVTPDTITSKLTHNTKAVIVVHFGGLAADITAIRAALPENIVIIEDGAHALGARYLDNRPVGSSGNLTCFSFYANKNLSTGEGGAIALADESLADKLRSLRQHGLDSNAWKRFIDKSAPLETGIKGLGYKMNYTDLNASIGRVQLRRQLRFSEIRLNIASLYHKHLSPLVGVQENILDASHARHLFVITLPLNEKSPLSRNEILRELREKNIGASIHYLPLHYMPIYKREENTRLTVTENLYKNILTLPISASMTESDAVYVITNIIEFLGDTS